MFEFRMMSKAANGLAQQAQVSPEVNVGRVSADEINQDPGATLARLGAQERLWYDRVYRPVNQDIIQSIGNNNLVDMARSRGPEATEAARQRAQRQRARYSIGNDGLSQRDQTREDAFTGGITYDGLVNSARSQQYERDVGLRSEMINLSRGIASSGMNDLENATAMATDRANTNANIRSQNKQARTQALGTAAGFMLMMI